jgi:hypothetical protein
MEESMLVGHFAVAFVAKHLDPKISFGTLVVASMLPDLLWPIFSMMGIEYVAGGTGENNLDIAISHSLLTVSLWGALFAGAYFLRRRYTRGMWVLFAAVLSHWFLDSVSHSHAIAPGVQTRFGFWLWNYFSATILIEGGFWLLAIALFVRATHPSKRTGVYAFWPVIVFLTFIWVTNIRTGPPPPQAVIGSLIFFLLLVGWAYWMNRVRPPTSGQLD